MTPSGSYEVEPVGPHRLHVRILGELREDLIARLSSDVLPRIGQLGADGELIVDLQQMTSCSTVARMQLAEFQRGVARHEVRTAFVANRPRFRGVGMWVAHISEDPNARSFPQMHQAQHWLRSTEGRLQSLTRYLTRALETMTPGKVRRSSQELAARVKELRDSSDGEGP